MNVSVIIPCHNAALWIGDAIRSVAKQTVSPIQIILVDDASTDNSIDIARSIGNAIGIPLEIISVNVHNAAAARNVGIAAVQGKWVAFLDADDEWLSDHIERASKLLGPTDVAYMGTSRLRYTSNRSQVFDRTWPNPWPSVPRSGLDRWDFLNWFSAVPCFNNSSVVVSLDALRSLGGFDTNLRRRHDNELFMRVICQGTWCFDSNPSAIIQRDTPGSISRNFVESYYYQLVGLRKNYEAYRSPQMDYLINQIARSTMRYALVLGSSQEMIRAWKVSRPVFSLAEKVIYGLLRLAPGMSRYLYKLKDSFGRNGRSPSPTEKHVPVFD